jgi:hypothetical protein
MIDVVFAEHENGDRVFTFTLDTQEEFSRVWPPVDLVCQCKWRDYRNSDNKITVTQTWIPGCTSHIHGMAIHNVRDSEYRVSRADKKFPVTVTVMK